MSQTGNMIRMVAAVSLTLMLSGAAFGEVSIRLTGVPETLNLPVPLGTNPMLSATITGGEVKSVWMGSNESSGASARVPLSKVGEGEFQINLGERAVFDLLKSQDKDGEFRIFAETTAGATIKSASVRFSTRSIPKRLDFPWDEAKITLFQRSLTELPGSDGALRVQLGVVTVGQVLVSVYGPNNEILVDLKRMRVEDALRLSLDEAEYVIHLDKLFDSGAIRDFAIFTIMPTRTWERRRILRLCKMVEETDVIFIRDEHMMGNESFATFMRGKLEKYGAKNPTLTKFIDESCTRSPTTGEPYGIKLLSGTEGGAAAWLHSMAEEIRDATR